MRHARATCAEVDLAQTADEIRITLRDNGIGQAEPHEGFGIRSLRERAMALGGVFLWYAWRIWRNYSDELAQKTFRYSIVYLTALFAVLLVDHYIRW